MLKIEEARIQSTSFRPRVGAVDTLVLHYTALDLDASLRVLRNRGVSVHWVLAEDGRAFRILNDHEVGFHAGLSSLRGKKSVNERSIGIEIVNLDGNENEYPPAQVDGLIELCKKILADNPGIPARNVVGHSDVAPKRKVDPGKNFPGKRLPKPASAYGRRRRLPRRSAASRRFKRSCGRSATPRRTPMERKTNPSSSSPIRRIHPPAWPTW